MNKLLLFPHSHFCEKASWALNYKNVPFVSQPMVPGLHILAVKSKGCSGTSVPVFLSNGNAVQGSKQIIDYLDETIAQNTLTPKNKEHQLQAEQLETKMDQHLGESIRTILYSTLLDHPDFIDFCFTYGMSSFSKYIFKTVAPVVRKKIRQTYVLSDQHVKNAHEKFALGIEELNNRVKNHKYLIGNRFSRADIAVAALISLITHPTEHPFPWSSTPVPCPQAQKFIDQYKNSPTCIWAGEVYSKYRLS